MAVCVKEIRNKEQKKRSKKQRTKNKGKDGRSATNERQHLQKNSYCPAKNYKS